MQYGKIVAENMEKMRTQAAEWSVVGIVGESDGMPVFDFPTAYGQAPSLFSGSKDCCHLCGTRIKNYYWIKHDQNKWIMPVGSECVTHFDSGASGKELEKRVIAKQNRDFLRSVISVKNELWRKYATRQHLGYGRFTTNIHYRFYRQQHELYAALKKIIGNLVADSTRSDFDTSSSDGAITRWINKNRDEATRIVTSIKTYL